jgi:RNA polymerase sigma factor (sigma-70 family)
MAGRQVATVIRELLGRIAGNNGPGLSDDTLLQRFITQADEAAFETLMWRHGPMVWATCRRILAGSHDAEDAFQGTFLVLFRKARSVRKRVSVGSWLYKVAYRLCLHAQAQSARQPRRAGAAPEAGAYDDDPDPLGQEFLPILDEELNRLPEKHRAVLVLHYLEGKKVEQVAHELGLARGTVASRLARAKTILRSRLAGRGVALTTGPVAGVLSVRAEAAVVPDTVIHNTLQAAKLFTGGVTVAGHVATRAICLAEAALQPRLVIKAKVAALLVLAGLLAAGTGVVAYQIPAGRQPGAGQREALVPGQPAEEAKSGVQEHRRVDLTGDPLPEGAIARMGSVRFRHGASVSSVAFLNGGKALLGADWSGISVWDAKTGRQLRRIGDDFRGSFRTSSLSADGKRLAATEHRGHTIQVWDVTSGKLLRLMAAPRFSFAVLSPDGKTVASRSENTIHLWDVTGGKATRNWTADPKAVHDLVFSPDGKVLVSGGADKTIHVWDVTTGKERRRIAGHLDEVGRLLFSPDGRLLASVGCTTWEFKRPNGSSTIRNPDDKIHLWAFESGKELRQLAVPDQKSPAKARTALSDGIGAMAFTHDSKRLAGTTNTFKGQAIHFWDVSTGKAVGRLTAPFTVSLALSADDKLLATGTVEAVRLWDVHTGTEREVTRGHRGSVYGVALSPDGRVVASASLDGTVRLWEATTGKERQRLQGPEGAVYAVAFSPDGRSLVSGGSDGAVRFWDARTGHGLRRFQGRGETVFSLTYSADGKVLASSDRAGRICLRDSVSGKTLHEMKAGAFRLSFSRTGKVLYAWGDKKVRAWDTATGKQSGEFFAGHEDRSYAAAFAPNGKWVAVGGQEPVVLLYDLSSGKEVKRLTGLPGATSALAFSPDSRTLAWGGWGAGPVVLWEVATNQQRRRFPGHPARIHSLVFSPGGRLLASGSEDTTALLWDALAGTWLTGKRAGSSGQEVGRCWAGLADKDTSVAYEALCQLVAVPERAVPLLATHLKPVPAVSLEVVAKLIAELDSEEFKVRERAFKELERYGDLAGPSLRQALEKKPSEEVRHRGERLLARIGKSRQSLAHLRLVRAVEALERIGTPAAQAVLRKVAGGVPEAGLTQEAKDSLERIEGGSRR